MHSRFHEKHSVSKDQSQAYQWQPGSVNKWSLNYNNQSFHPFPLALGLWNHRAYACWRAVAQVALLDKCQYSMKSDPTTTLKLHKVRWKYLMRISGDKELLGEFFLQRNFLLFLTSGIWKLGLELYQNSYMRLNVSLLMELSFKFLYG